MLGISTPVLCQRRHWIPNITAWLLVVVLISTIWLYIGALIEKD